MKPISYLGYGLGTCIIAMTTFWPDIYRDLLGIPQSKVILLVIPIGYPDMDAKVNTFEWIHEPLGTLIRWHGM